MTKQYDKAKASEIKIGDQVQYVQGDIDVVLNVADDFGGGNFYGTCLDDCPDGIDYFFTADQVK